MRTERPETTETTESTNCAAELSGLSVLSFVSVHSAIMAARAAEGYRLLRQQGGNGLGCEIGVIVGIFKCFWTKNVWKLLQ
jgi:hypothetical protein